MKKRTHRHLESPSEDRRPKFFRAVVIVSVLALGVIGTVYSLYYLHRRDYLAQRNLRIVQSLSGRLDRNLDAHRGFLRNYAANQKLRRAAIVAAAAAVDKETPDMRGLGMTTRRTDSPLELALSQAWLTSARLDAAEAGKFLIPTLKDLTFAISPASASKRGEPAPNNSPGDAWEQRLATREGEPWVELSYRSADGMDASGRVTLKELFGDALAFDRSASFETFFVADASGRILTDVTAPTSTARIRRLDQLSERRLFSGPSALPVDRLAATPDVRRVQIGGRSYRLFTQPHAMWTSAEPQNDALGDSPGSPNLEQRWIIGGLVADDEFVSTALAVPSSLLLFGSAAAVFGFLIWPFLRLALMGSADRVRTRDVALAVVCTTASVAVLTLILLDAGFYQGIRSRSYEQLRVLNAVVRDHVQRELTDVLEQLRVADQHLPATVPDWHTTGGRERDFLRSNPGKPWSYPHFESIARIDTSGQQIAKWSTRKFATDLVDVKGRAYFAELASKRGWRVDPAIERDVLGTQSREETLEFYVQSIRSMTTGETEAVVSINSLDQRKSLVTAMATKLVSLTRPVMPPGFSFAVIDESGTVLFHREPARNLEENFFIETDDDSALRSAVYARVEKQLDLPYSGREMRASVHPIANTPWTLVTMRDKALERALNVDVVLIAGTMLLVYLLVVALVTIPMLLPRLRGSWLWPHDARKRLYARVAAATALLALSFALALISSTGGRLLLLSAIYPVMVLGVVAIARQRNPLLWTPGLVFTTALLLLLTLTLFSGPSLTEVWPGRLIALLAAAAGFITLGLEVQTPARMSGRLVYLVAGALIVLVVGALPATAFFKASAAMALDVFMKHAQLDLLRQYDAREVRIAKEFDRKEGDSRPPFREARSTYELDVYTAFFHGTIIDRRPAPPNPKLKEPPPMMWARLDPVLPRHSTHSTLTGALVHDDARESFRRWYREQRRIELRAPRHPAHSLENTRDVVAIRSSTLPLFDIGMVADEALPIDGNVVLAASTSFRDSNPPGKTIQTSSSPRRTMDGDSEGSVVDEIRPLSMSSLAGAAVVSALPPMAAFILITFLAQRIFLLGFLRPRADGGFKPAPGSNTLFFLTDRDDETLRGGSLVAFSMPAPESGAEAWTSWSAQVNQLPPDFVPVIHGWEAMIESGDCTGLEAAEALATNPERSLVLATSSTPIALLRSVERAPHPAGHRWQRMLATFSWRDRRIRSEDVPCPRHAAPSEAPIDGLMAESADDPYLEALISDIPTARESAEDLLEELAARASRHYESLWDASTPDEKMVLEHLARDGFVNTANRRAIRSLLRRGLIRICSHSPAPHLMNETFRSFVLEGGRRQEVSAIEATQTPSVWQVIKVPLSLVLAALLIFFFVTQREVFDATTTLIAGMAASLPAAFKIIAMIGGRRASAE